MKPVSELLKRRGPALFHIAPDTTVFDALHVLARHEVGALLVISEGKLVGVLSERDYTRKVALLGKNSKEMKVSEIMTANVITVTSKSNTVECMNLMSQKRIRHLPVIDGTTFGRIVRASPATRDTPIIVMSGTASLDQLLPVAIDGFLAKPFDIEVLLRLVVALIGVPTVDADGHQ